MMLASCSHKYDSNTLDLAFYQWNMWPDKEAVAGSDLSPDPSVDISAFPVNPPSCGWEVLHRGNGKLLRIPATVGEHFSGETYAAVYWYHCRFTLPELWEAKDIRLQFAGAGPGVEVYLNEAFVGLHQGIGTPFDINITDKVYYTLDNHLAIRITNPGGVSGQGIAGVTGNISVKSSDRVDQESD